jgi:hypothetical protein
MAIQSREEGGGKGFEKPGVTGGDTSEKNLRQGSLGFENQHECLNVGCCAQASTIIDIFPVGPNVHVEWRAALRRLHSNVLLGSLIANSALKMLTAS